LLRQAANNGYQAGRADRQDRWGSNYQGSYGYQDANYAYDGYYIDRDNYNYYFREGFQRGYQDRYSRKYQYGRHTNGSYSMLDVICRRFWGFNRSTDVPARRAQLACSVLTILEGC
jgi:hypothetical protein